MDLEQSTMSQTAALSVGSITFGPATADNCKPPRSPATAGFPSERRLQVGEVPHYPFIPPKTLKDALGLETPTPPFVVSGGPVVSVPVVDGTVLQNKIRCNVEKLLNKVKADYDQMDFFNRTEGGGHSLALNKLGLIQVALTEILSDIQKTQIVLTNDNTTN